MEKGFSQLDKIMKEKDFQYTKYQKVNASIFQCIGMYCYKSSQRNIERKKPTSNDIFGDYYKVYYELQEESANQ